RSMPPKAGPGSANVSRESGIAAISATMEKVPRKDWRFTGASGSSAMIRVPMMTRIISGSTRTSSAVVGKKSTGTQHLRSSVHWYSVHGNDGARYRNRLASLHLHLHLRVHSFQHASVRQRNRGHEGL